MEEKKELLDQDERVVEIELERLRGFVNHPFKVQADSQMIELQESIKKYGILNPLIVRPRQDGTYEIISGHRRKFAAEKIGYRKVPVIISVLKDDEAVVSMVDSNLQREMIMTNVLTAFSCQRTFVIFYLLNSDITGGVVHNYAFSCIHRHIGCR